MIRVGCVLTLCLAAGSACAAAPTPNDYAQQWPLAVGSGDAGAYRVTLPPEVYAAAQDPNLADVQVFNAAGQAVPTALLPPETPATVAPAPTQRPVPWFVLPPAQGADGAADWQIHAERDAQGRVARVDLALAEHAPPPAGSRLLLDLSQAGERVVALQFHWEPTASLELGFRFETSSDLEHWQPLEARGVLLELNRKDAVLTRRRIDLPTPPGAYLRLTPTRSDQALTLTAIDAETVPGDAAAAPAWAWRELQGTVVASETRDVVYRLDARIPVERLDVVPAGNNAVAQWTVDSRENDKRPWQRRAGPWTGYRLQEGGDVESSPEQSTAPTRDREWRVHAGDANATAPSLRLGYRPEQIVFVAAGEGPFRLAAGSARARREDTPVAAVLAQLRQRHGKDWKPTPATLGAATTLGGAQALTPAPKPAQPLDARKLLLWLLLVGGTALVVALAVSLLRSERRRPD